MDSLMQLGVGAAITILILDRVIQMLKVFRLGSKSNGTSGDQPVSFWEAKMDREESTLREMLLNDRETLKALVQIAAGIQELVDRNRRQQ